MTAYVKKQKYMLYLLDPERGVQIHMHGINRFAECSIENLYKAMKSNLTKTNYLLTQDRCWQPKTDFAVTIRSCDKLNCCIELCKQDGTISRSDSCNRCIPGPAIE